MRCRVPDHRTHQRYKHPDRVTMALGELQQEDMSPGGNASWGATSLESTGEELANAGDRRTLNERQSQLHSLCYADDATLSEESSDHSLAKGGIPLKNPSNISVTHLDILPVEERFLGGAIGSDSMGYNSQKDLVSLSSLYDNNGHSLYQPDNHTRIRERTFALDTHIKTKSKSLDSLNQDNQIDVCAYQPNNQALQMYHWQHYILYIFVVLKVMVKDVIKNYKQQTFINHSRQMFSNTQMGIFDRIMLKLSHLCIPVTSILPSHFVSCIHPRQMDCSQGVTFKSQDEQGLRSSRQARVKQMRRYRAAPERQLPWWFSHLMLVILVLLPHTVVCDEAPLTTTSMSVATSTYSYKSIMTTTPTSTNTSTGGWDNTTTVQATATSSTELGTNDTTTISQNTQSTITHSTQTEADSSTTEPDLISPNTATTTTSLDPQPTSSILEPTTVPGSTTTTTLPETTTTTTTVHESTTTTTIPESTTTTTVPESTMTTTVPDSTTTTAIPESTTTMTLPEITTTKKKKVPTATLR